MWAEKKGTSPGHVIQSPGEWMPRRSRRSKRLVQRGVVRVGACGSAVGQLGLLQWCRGTVVVVRSMTVRCRADPDPDGQSGPKRGARVHPLWLARCFLRFRNILRSTWCQW